MKKRSPNATVKTTYHPPGVHALQGSVERRMMLVNEAAILKTRGFSLRQIADQLVIQFSLETTPQPKTVYEWIDEGLIEGRENLKEAAETYARLTIARSEKLIRSLWDIATGKVIVQRTKMVAGFETQILDEEAIKEQIQAAAEIRKQMQLECQVLGVTKRDDLDLGAMDMKTAQTFIVQTINNFADPSKALDAGAAGKVLELHAGDPEIDSM